MESTRTGSRRKSNQEMANMPGSSGMPPHGSRISSSGQEPSLTASFTAAAQALGVSPSAIRLYVARGKLKRAGKRGREALIELPDRLDWAREKLGLPTGGAA